MPEGELGRLVLGIGATLGIEALVWLTELGGLSREEALRCLKRRICDAILQEPRGGFSGAFAQRRLTKRSRELRKPELFMNASESS